MDLLENPAPGGARHPWETRRAAFFFDVLGRGLAGRGAGGPGLSVLDCGSGDAWLASELSRALRPRGIGVASVTCWDANYDDASVARFQKVYPHLSFTRERPSGAFDVVLMMDVLEHVADDVGFVRDVVDAALAPDGLALVSVPAWQLLYGRHDRFLLHHRRYRPAQCDAVLRAAGLRVIARGGAFHSLLAPRTLAILAERAASVAGLGGASTGGGGAQWSGGPVVTGVVAGALRLDNALSRWASSSGINLPGLTYWALCQKA